MSQHQALSRVLREFGRDDNLGLARTALAKWADVLAYGHAAGTDEQPGDDELATWFGRDVLEASRHLPGDDAASWYGRVIAVAINEAIDCGLPDDN